MPLLFLKYFLCERYKLRTSCPWCQMYFCHSFQWEQCWANDLIWWHDCKVVLDGPNCQWIYISNCAANVQPQCQKWEWRRNSTIQYHLLSYFYISYLHFEYYCLNHEWLQGSEWSKAGTWPYWEILNVELMQGLFNLLEFFQGSWIWSWSGPVLGILYFPV